MSLTSAIVLYLVCWFMTLFVVLPLNLQTQGESGERVMGTHASAPAQLDMWRKVYWITGVSFVVWAIIVGVIVSGVISVSDFDVMGRMGKDGS